MQRYDRQIRIWSGPGQKKLENAHVWVTGQSLAISECLKNLSLAGLGALTIEKDSFSNENYYNNEKLSLEAHLLELNPQLSIHNYKEERLRSKSHGSPNGRVDLVIFKDSDPSHETLIGIPRIQVRSTIMTGSIKLLLSAPLPILDTHPPNGYADLRFNNLWPEYQSFCDAFKLSEMDESAFRHIPWCVLGVKAYQGLGENPDRKTIVAELNSMRKYGDEDNFDEALKNSFMIKANTIPEGLTSVMREAASQRENIGTYAWLWRLALALDLFVKTWHRLPVSGVVSDMVCDTETYINLRQIYADKAAQDVDAVMKLLGDEQLPRDIVESFCQKCRYMKLLKPTEALDSELSQQPKQGPPELEHSEECEIGTVAAMIGGIAAQEIVKVITNHFTPIMGEILVDGLDPVLSVQRRITMIN